MKKIDRESLKWLQAAGEQWVNRYKELMEKEGGQPTDWESIANELADALESFTAYDGYGQGGADDSNSGDWKAAYKALHRHRKGG